MNFVILNLIKKAISNKILIKRSRFYHSNKKYVISSYPMINTMVCLCTLFQATISRVWRHGKGVHTCSSVLYPMPEPSARPQWLSHLSRQGSSIHGAPLFSDFCTFIQFPFCPFGRAAAGVWTRGVTRRALTPRRRDRWNRPLFQNHYL